MKEEAFNWLNEPRPSRLLCPSSATPSPDLTRVVPASVLVHEHQTKEEPAQRCVWSSEPGGWRERMKRESRPDGRRRERRNEPQQLTFTVLLQPRFTPVSLLRNQAKRCEAFA